MQTLDNHATTKPIPPTSIPKQVNPKTGLHSPAAPSRQAELDGKLRREVGGACGEGGMVDKPIPRVWASNWERRILLALSTVLFAHRNKSNSRTKTNSRISRRCPALQCRPPLTQSQKLDASANLQPPPPPPLVKVPRLVKMGE